MSSFLCFPTSFILFLTFIPSRFVFRLFLILLDYVFNLVTNQIEFNPQLSVDVSSSFSQGAQGSPDDMETDEYDEVCYSLLRPLMLIY